MSQRFCVHYPDGSRAKVTREQHKQMLRDGVLEPLAGNQYRYTGHAFHFRNLADLRLFRTVITTVKRLKHYPGLFIWQHDRKRRRETLEPPEKLALRLNLATVKTDSPGGKDV